MWSYHYYYLSPLLPLLSPCAVLSQLQQELNYRFLQDRSSGVLIAHPNQVEHSHQQHHLNGLQQHHPDRRDSSQAIDTASSSSMGASVGVTKQPGFKWCYAHVAIAKQIQQQQQHRAKVSRVSVFVPLSLESCGHRVEACTYSSSASCTLNYHSVLMYRVTGALRSVPYLELVAYD